MKEKLLKIVNNREVWGYLASVAIMVVLSIAFFHPDSIEGNSLNQYDMMQGAANGQEIKEYREQTGVNSRWTNSLFSGMPTFQISPTYSSDSLFKWIDTVMRCGLPEPSGYLFSMMFGFLIMCACMKMRWYYALIGSVAWGFSSYFIIIIGAGHLWKFFTLTYVPPVIGGVIMAYRGQWLAGSAVAALFAMMQIAANHVQMTYYFLFVILALAIAYLVKSIKEGAFTKWCFATSCLLGAGVLAVAANSPSLYNTYQYSKETIRGQHSLLTGNGQDNAGTGLDKDYITQYSYGRAETFTLLIPNVKGGASAKPVNGQMKPLTLADLPSAAEGMTSGQIRPQEGQFLPYVSQYFGEPESTNGPVYVGAIICALFLLGCFIVRGPLKWALLVMTVLSILLALGRNAMWLTDFFIDYVPMYKNFRTPESILVVAEFAMPLLGILGLIEFFKSDNPFVEHKTSLLYAFGIPAFFCVLGFLWPGIYGEAITQADMVMQPEVINHYGIDSGMLGAEITSLRHSMVEADSFRSFIFLALAVGILLAVKVKIFPQWVGIMGIGILITGDLYTADKRYLSHESFTSQKMSVEEQFPVTDIDRMLAADTAQSFRVLDIPRFYHPAPSYRHKMIGGYHAAKLTRYNDLIEQHLAHFTGGAELTQADLNVASMLNAKYIVDGQNQILSNPDALGNAWFVDKIDWVDSPDAEMAALQTIDPARTAAIDKAFSDVIKAPSDSVVPTDTIFMTSYAPDKLTYHAKVAAKEGLAVFSEVYFPWGWTATVDGNETPIARADYVLRAINIPQGDHTVEMRFDPPSVHSTETLAYISIILIYLLLSVAVTKPLWSTAKTEE